MTNSPHASQQPQPSGNATTSVPAQTSSGTLGSLAQLSVAALLEATAAKQPTPGGGAVAGVCGALASSLGHMVVAYSLGKKSLAAHQPLLSDAGKRLTRARAMLLELADEDAHAYGMVNELSRLPEGDARREQLPLATLVAAQIPLALAACALDVLRLLSTLCGASNPHLRSDLAIAAVLADATVKASRWNVEINLPSLSDPQRRAAMQEQIDSFVRTSAAMTHDIESRCREGW
jgi:formiminotetrahydrofolate cyclodeaminase